MTPEQLAKKLTRMKLEMSKKALKAIADRTVKEIKARTIDGYGVSPSGEVENFKGLKPATIKQRSNFKNLDSRTSPETSNQIRSGQLVDGIHAEITEDGVDILPSRKRAKDKADGQEVANGQEKMGRTIFKLEEDQLEQIKDDVRAEVQDLFKKLLKQ